MIPFVRLLSRVIVEKGELINKTKLRVLSLTNRPLCVAESPEGSWTAREKRETGLVRSTCEKGSSGSKDWNGMTGRH